MAGLLDDIGANLGGMLGNLGTATQNFLQSPSIASGIGNAIRGATTGQATDQAGAFQQVQQQVLKTLIANGVHPQRALLAVQNPDELKAVIGQLNVTPNFQQTGEDQFGGKQYGFVNPQNQTITQPQFLPPPGQSPASAMPTSPFMAPGVRAINSDLGGEDYLKQFSPEIQQQAKDYLSGKVTLTGRQQQAMAVKRIAEKYGADIGTPADENTILERRKLQMGLAGTAPSTAGGQIALVNTSVGHLLNVAKSAENLGNSDLWNSTLTNAFNYIKNASTPGQAKMASLKDAALRYGEEITKFYAGSPGAQAERQHFIDAIGGTKSPRELAAVIQQEANLLPEKVGSLGNQIQTLLGPEGSAKYPILYPETQNKLGSIQEITDRMSGRSSAPAPSRAAPPAAINALKANPSLRGQFDQYYGPGSAAKVLGGG